MALQSKQIDQEPKPRFAGIDVGAEELILVIRKNGTPYKAQKFTNTPADRDWPGERSWPRRRVSSSAWRLLESITSIYPLPFTTPGWR